VSFPLENPYLVIQRPIKLSPILLDGYLVYLSNATGLDAKRVLFLAQLFLQNTTRSDLGNFKTYFVNYFWVKPILSNHVLLFLTTAHRINFSEMVRFSGRFISDSVVISTIKCIEYSLLIRKLQIQFGWVFIIVSYLILCWFTCFDQVLCLLDVVLSIGLFSIKNCFPY
jgi:hypothetical protein